MQAAEQPEHQKHDNHQTQNSAQARGPVPLVRVVTTTATKQQNKYNDDKDQTHDAPGRLFPLSISRRLPNDLERYSFRGANGRAAVVLIDRVRTALKAGEGRPFHPAMAAQAAVRRVEPIITPYVLDSH